MAKVRLFKVYARKPGCSAHAAANPERNPDHELCFTRSHKMAAEIAQTIWHENGFDCKRFQVVELMLPECAQEGKFVGLVWEPNSNGRVIELRLQEDDVGRICEPKTGCD